MSTQTKAPELWATEPSNLPGHARIRARIAGLHCSLCTGTIEKALGRIDGVGQVAVSMTHEQALVDYDPSVVLPERILSTLRDLGYDLYDPRKLRSFEEEEAALVREGLRLLAAIMVSLTAIGLIATVTGIWSVLVPLSVAVVMIPISFVILRPAGKVAAAAGAIGVVAPAVAALVLRATDVLHGSLIGWLAGALALAVVFWVARHILAMAYQSARRGILNQHVLLEAGAFAGIAGDIVVSGALNGAGTLLVEVTAAASESFLAQVVRHVEDARALKPGILHLVDRVLRVYTPAVLILSGLALIGWLAGSVAITGEMNIQRAVFAALTVLVMGYPCAVGIAAPLAIVRGAGEAADLGIIMRTGEAIQSLRTITHVLLDKTGTLTVGHPTVQGIHPQPGVEADELLAFAAAAEAHSEHPLADAITRAAADRHLMVPQTTGFQSSTGFGVAATVNGQRVRVGRPGFLTSAGVDLTGLQEAIANLEGEGHTVIAVARNDRALGIIALADRVRPEAANTVARLRAAGLTPVLVTGDSPRAAEHVASLLGIDEVHAEVLPEGKAELVGKLQAGGHKVAMVGDGINDAPALMRADVGIALGSGTDIATESADIIIIRDDLNLLLTAHDISRRSYRRVKQNVALAFTFNGIGIPLAATGLIYPVWAMVAMAASVTTIFVNSIGGRPSLLFQAIASVGHRPEPTGRN